MPPVVHAVGLGPAGADLLSVGTVEVLDRVEHRFVRTVHHPAASAVGDATAFDDVYDRGETIEGVYRSIVEQLVAAALEHGEVVYAVPGSPVVAEHTVELLIADPRVRTVVHPAMSFLDLTWARLGIDPVERGVRLVDGHRFVVEAAGQRGPLLVAQCDSRFVLSDIKLAVEHPPTQPVVLLTHLGLPDERLVQVPWEDLDRSIEPDHLTSLWIPQLAEPVAAELVRVDELMRRLRREDPWKAEQTHGSLQRYLLEESHEVLEAIDAYDPDSGDGADELCSELGDLLYQVVFHSTLAAEAGWFTLADVATAIHDKLERRHPHIGSGAVATPTRDELVRAWETDKRDEMGRASRYDGIPADLPALARAAKVLRKADPTPERPTTGTASSGIGDTELGELLWQLVERAHVAGLDPEQALRREVDRRVAGLRADER